MNNNLGYDFHIGSLINNIKDYSRQHLFYVEIDWSRLNITRRMDDRRIKLLIKSSMLPSSVIPITEVNWQGMKYKLGSTHDFADWTCTFNVDADDNIRSLFTDWMQLIHSPISNRQSSPPTYMTSIYATHVNGIGSDLLQYTLHHTWPTNVGEITLDYGNKTAVAEFQVTFTYHWHTVCASKTGGFIDPTNQDSCINANGRYEDPTMEGSEYPTANF